MSGASVVAVDVALTPDRARRWHGRVCVLVDELRASSAIVTLLDGGCAAVIPFAGIGEARREARARGHVLVGERGGLRPPGYDFSTSPVELSGAIARGSTAVLRSQNGARVARQLPAAPALLIGCLLNVTACSRAALARSRASGASIGIVCAGLHGSFALDDALAAGALVDRLGSLAGGDAVELTDAALAALRIWRGFQEPRDGLRLSASGRLLMKLGLAKDIEACARVDASRTVPVLVAGPPPSFTSSSDGAPGAGRNAHER